MRDILKDKNWYSTYLSKLNQEKQKNE